MLSRLLKSFSTVAEAGSVVRAAGILRVAQPALTRQIQQLEEEAGVQLFRRERRGVTLTPAGVALLEQTRTFFARIDLAIRHAREAEEGTRGALRLGLGRIAVDHPSVGAALAIVRQRFPAVRLDVCDLASWNQPAALVAREVDVAIGATEFVPTGLIRSELLCEDVVDTAVVPSCHPIARQGVVDVAELFDLRHLTLDKPLGLFPPLLQALKVVGLTRYELYTSVESMYNMVAAGRGWACVPHSMHPPVGTTIVALRDFSHAIPILVGWRRDDESRAIANVVGSLLEEMGRARPTHEPQPCRVPQLPDGGRRPSWPVDLEQLRTLAVVIDEGSLSRAAARLHLSQPGVTRRLHALRRGTGLPLIRRVSHGVVGTPAGLALTSDVPVLLQLVQGALANARRVGQGITGLYRIGAIPLELAGPRLLRALQQIQARLPHLEVTVEEMLSEQAGPALTSGHIDVAFVSHIPGVSFDPEIERVHVDDDEIDCVLLPARHRLARRTWLTPAELALEPFVFISRAVSPRLHDGVMRSLAAIGLCPRVIGWCDGPRPMWRAVVNSMAWTIGRRSQRSQPPAGLVAIPLEGLNVPCGNQLVWVRERRDQGLRELLDIFREADPHDAVLPAAEVAAAAGS